MLNQPTSSPMMTRMLGGFAPAACACAAALPAARKHDTANTPSVSLRTTAPILFIVSLSKFPGWLPNGFVRGTATDLCFRVDRERRCDLGDKSRQTQRHPHLAFYQCGGIIGGDCRNN